MNGVQYYIMIICSESYTTSTSIIGEKIIKTLYYYLQVLLVEKKKTL